VTLNGSKDKLLQNIKDLLERNTQQETTKGKQGSAVHESDLHLVEEGVLQLKHQL